MFCGSILGEEVVGRSRYSSAETVRQRERAQMRMTPYVRTQFVDEFLSPHKFCQYMGGSEIGPICGEPSVPDYSYCENHKKECYAPRK